MIKRYADIFKFLKTMLCIVLVALCLCACDSNKGNINVIDTDDKAYNDAIDDEKSDLDLEDKVQEQQRSCWQAQFLYMFYQAMADSSLKAYPKVTSSAMPFIMVAFAVWLSLRLLKHVSSVVEESSAEVWTEVAKMAFTCLCCGLLASSTAFLLFALNKLIFPIYYAFLEYGSLVLNAMTTGGDINSPGIYLGDPEGDKGVCLIYQNSLVCKAPELEDVTMSHFPTGPSEMMQCLTCAVSDRLQLGFALAKQMMSSINFSGVICGIIIYAIFLIVKIAFVFYIVDSIFRMNIMIILLPCLILAYPFKFSRKWTKTGFLMAINSAAIMAFMALISAIAMLAMQIIIENNADTVGNLGLYQEFGTISLTLVLISFMVLKSISTAVTLANSLVGGGGSTDFQKKIAKMGAWLGKKAFSFVTFGIGKILTKSSVGQNLKERRDKIRQKMRELAGRE